MSEPMTDNGSTMAGRIEGGIDAIVIGAGVEGLAAAAILGRAKFKTVLVDSVADFGGAIAKRHFADGAPYDDGEHLVWRLDPALADGLDLYRFGVAFAARRLDTVYMTGAGAVIRVDGDLLRGAAKAPAEAGVAIEELMRLAAPLAPAMRQAGGDARALKSALEELPVETHVAAETLMQTSALDFLESRMIDSAYGPALAAEASFRASASPSEPYSLFALVERWSGEASGLQAGVAYPEGGATTIIEALRRAAQSASVDIRASTHVRAILIEKDRVAGVSLDNGGQLRAPIVISALDGQTTFGRLIGPEHLDPEFSACFQNRAPQVTSAMLHLQIEEGGVADQLENAGGARYFYAPRLASIEAAFAAARRGDVPDELILEFVFPDCLGGKPDAEPQRISVMAHPAPLWRDADAAKRGALEKAIIATLAKAIPGAESRIRQAVLRTADEFAAASGRDVAALASPPVFARQWARIGVLTEANRIGGLYFCGPEAQLAPGISGAAGRNAARKAIAAANKGELT